jgi:3D (Asp-Asp-Asp) domain-containing protein
MRHLGPVLVAVLFVAASAEASHSTPHRGALRMNATAYCDRGPTKSGVKAQRGIAAADLRRFPIGTRLRVIAPGQPYAGTYTVLDSGSEIKGRDLDIFMPSCRAAKRFGKRPVNVRILGNGKNRRNR